MRVALARWESDHALMRSEERLRLAVDAANLGVWEWATDANVATTVGRFHPMFGGSPRSIAESLDAFLGRVHPDDLSDVQAALKSTLQQGTALDQLFRYHAEGGGVGWLQAHAKAFYDQGPAVARVIGVLQEVTERIQTEERLRQAGTVFDTTAEGIFILDKDHRILSVNPAFSSITGFQPEEVLGADPEIILHARRHSDVFYPRLEQGDAQWEGEIWCRRKNGEIFPAWENVGAVRDTQGQVTHFVVTFADISSMHRAEEQLRHLAHHDPLTGLPNRLLSNDRIDQALTLAQRNQEDLAVLYIDLDGFKTINDTLGHSSGDLLLQTLAGRLRDIVRASDTVARLGGDEFVVLLPALSHPEDAARIAQNVLTELAAPVELAGERIAVSASIGLALYPRDGTTRVDLLKAADTAMYHSKSQGRNRYSFYTQELATQVRERMSLEQGLKRSLENGDFLLHYQPQVRLDDRQLAGFEALIRWQRPEEGLISPARFIPIAEDMGLIESLGSWVLKRACAEMVEMGAALGWLPRLSVNVSGRQLVRNQFDKIVAQTLAETGFPAAQLELEITESTLQVLEHQAPLLRALKNLGVSVAIDDFGTGYSSLSTLKHLPIDRLKIDQSFVRDISSDGNDVAIVEAIAALGHTLKLGLVAEGVETEDQFATLKRLGCEECQGYLFSRPVPIQEAQAYCAAV